jgi:tetratricopeptide (TPR) repeat protein
VAKSRKSRTKPAGKHDPGQQPVKPVAEVVVTSAESRRKLYAVCLALAAITVAVLAQTLGHGFVNIDDGPYVYENSNVTNGLTMSGIAHAFTKTENGTWDPLTTISHMADCQVYGLNPAGHHLTNILLHTASVVLLFLVLQRMTGALWPSAFVAALFAIHPLRVESVAWVSERKDTLSGLFFMLTLWAYVKYVGEFKVQGSRFKVYYLLTLVLFALGLMSKAMLVTLPVILLLLDYWPLGRCSKFKVQSPTAALAPKSGAASQSSKSELQQGGVPLSRLLIEKLPLFALSACSAIVASLAQRQGHGLPAAAIYPLALRFENAVVSAATYLWQFFFPVGLAVFYPFPAHGWEIWRVGLSLIALAFICAVAVRWRRTRPWLLVGLLWYLVMLLPVIGVFQLGRQAHADRYTYLPQIGIYLALTWLAANAFPGWHRRRVVLRILGALAVAAFAATAFIQASFWQSSVRLWQHTIACTPDNAVAHYALGTAYLKANREDDALAELQKAVAAQPDFSNARYDLAAALAKKGQLDDAIRNYQAAIAADPDLAEAYFGLGSAFAHQGRNSEAIAAFEKTLDLQPNYAAARYNLGTSLAAAGRFDDAITQFEMAVQEQPDFMEAHINLAATLVQKGRLDEAITQYQAAVALKPDDTHSRLNLGKLLETRGRLADAGDQYQALLGRDPASAEARARLLRVAWVMATSPDAASRNGAKSLELAKAFTELPGSDAVEQAALAAAYAETGQFPEALKTAGLARQMALAQNNAPLAAALQEQLNLYQAGHPFRDAGKASGQAPH